MITKFLQRTFNTRPDEDFIESKRQEMKSKSKQAVKSLRKTDQALQKNLDITHNIAIAMGILRYKL